MTTLEILNGQANCLIAKATLETVDGSQRFQPAGFPEIGHVLYHSPLRDGGDENVCIIDSAASMANHLETVCLAGGESLELHPDLTDLPYVACMTKDEDKKDKERVTDRLVCTTFTEGHRLASDYFLKATFKNEIFREILRREMQIKELTKDKKYFFYPDGWPQIYKTIFRYDPNSLVHGLLFAREELKISRILTAQHEGHGAKRVLSSGVKFDKLGKTLSGQPIFSVDEETASNIQATFCIDLGLLRSYGRGKDGLSDNEKGALAGSFNLEDHPDHWTPVSISQPLSFEDEGMCRLGARWVDYQAATRFRNKDQHRRLQRGPGSFPDPGDLRFNRTFPRRKGRQEKGR